MKEVSQVLTRRPANVNKILKSGLIYRPLDIDFHELAPFPDEDREFRGGCLPVPGSTILA